MAKRLVTVDTDTKVLEGAENPVHSGSLTVEATHPYIILSDTTTPAKQLRLRYDSYSGLFEIRNITDDVVAVTLATDISGITRIIGTNLSVYNETPQLELYDKTAGGKRVVMENNLSENSLILTNVTDGIILDQIDLSTGARKIDLTVEKDTPKVNLKDTAAGGKEYRIYSQGGNLYVYNQTEGREVVKFYPDKGIGFADTKEYRIYAEGDNLVIKNVTDNKNVVVYPKYELGEIVLLAETQSTTSSDFINAGSPRTWRYYVVRDYIDYVKVYFNYTITSGSAYFELYDYTNSTTIKTSPELPTGTNMGAYLDVTEEMKAYTSAVTVGLRMKSDGTNTLTAMFGAIEIGLKYG